MRLLPGLVLALSLTACGQKSVAANNVVTTANAAEPQLPVETMPANGGNMTAAAPPMRTLASGYLLGVMQRPGRTAESGGSNEWILTLDPERRTLYYGEIVEGRTSRIAGPYKAPVVSGETATLTAGDLTATFTVEPCESDHGGLGSGTVRATITIAGDTPPEPITMCMVSQRPGNEVGRPDWAEDAF